MCRKLSATLLLFFISLGSISAQQKITIENFNWAIQDSLYTLSTEGTNKCTLIQNTSDKMEGTASLDVKYFLDALHQWGTYFTIGGHNMKTGEIPLNFTLSDTLMIWIKVNKAPVYPENMSFRIHLGDQPVPGGPIEDWIYQNNTILDQVHDWYQLKIPLKEILDQELPSVNGFVVYPRSWGNGTYNNSRLDLDKIVSYSIVVTTEGFYNNGNLPADSLEIQFDDFSKNIKRNDVSLLKDWNIVSVPVLTSDMNTQTLFPGYTSPTYSYLNEYQTASVLENGKGYWIRYGQDASVSLDGSQILSTTIPVSADWNLIGVFDRSISVASISTTPNSIIVSRFFGYSNGYYIPETLLPGKGYWIRASQNGVLNLNYSNTQTAKTNVKQELKDSWGKIIVEDNSGSRRVLYISDKNENSSSDFDLPPVPPLGVFDVRYSTDRILESSESATINISSAEYPVKISSEGMDLRIKDVLNGSSLNAVLKNGQSVTITNSSLDKLMVERISKSVPLSYELHQNYPNPFNPSTSFRYSLPEKAEISLVIYNQLGEKVAEVDKGVKEAGNYQVRWNAEGIASGMYIYELRTGNFRSEKKLMLLK